MDKVCGPGIVVTFVAMIVYMFTSQINKSVLICETFGESKPNTLGLRIFLVQHLIFRFVTISIAWYGLDKNSVACHYTDSV